MTAQPIPRETLASSFDQAGALQMARQACIDLGYDISAIPEQVLESGTKLVGRCNGYVVKDGKTVFDSTTATPTPLSLRRHFQADCADRKIPRLFIPKDLPQLLGLPAPAARP